MSLQQNETSSDRILVIGAGVVGLTTAIRLHESGYAVTVVADRFAPDLTSVVAGALWEWPPAVCGRHGDPRSLERSKRWCMASYRKFRELDREHSPDATGIHLRPVYFYFYEPLEDNAFELGKMNEIAARVDGFARGLEILPAGVDPGFRGGIRDVYRHLAPMVDTDTYMAWLLERVKAQGIRIVQEKIDGNLVENEAALLRRFGAAAIVNCAGLGALAISGDGTMYPLRGALVRVIDAGRIVEAAHCIAHGASSTSEQDIIFIVPRGRHGLVLGGLVQKDRWGTDLSLEHPLISQMYQGCLDFLPALRDLPLDEAEPVRTGLRPFTRENVCLETVPGCRIVHNYGHGGAGVTLSWGCADEVVARVGEIVRSPAGSAGVPPAARLENAERRPDARGTLFVLHGEPPVEADFRGLPAAGRSLVLLATRRALGWLAPAQYRYFDRVEICEQLDEGALAKACRLIAGGGAIAGVVTGDPTCERLAAALRAALGTGRPEGGLPFPSFSDGGRQTPRQEGELSHGAVAVYERGRALYFAALRYSGDPDEPRLDRPLGCLLLPEDDPAARELERVTAAIFGSASGAPLHGVFHLRCRMPAGGGEAVLTHLIEGPPPAPVARMLAYCRGVSLSALHLRSQIDGVLALALRKPDQRWQGACSWQPPRPGVVARLERPEVRCEIDATWRIYPGMQLAAPAGREDFAVFFVLRHPDFDLVRAEAAKLDQAFCYELEPAPTAEPAPALAAL